MSAGTAGLRLVPPPTQGTDTPSSVERSLLIESLVEDLHELYFWQTPGRVRLDMSALRACVREAMEDHSCHAVVVRADPGSEAVRRGTAWILAVFPGSRRRALPRSEAPLLLRALSSAEAASYSYFATHADAVSAAASVTRALRPRRATH